MIDTVGFMTQERRDGFDRYVEAPSREKLERFFRPSDDDHKAILPLRGEHSQLEPEAAAQNLDAELDSRGCDHDLPGEWAGYRECHIKPDLLLIYPKSDSDTLRLARLARMGKWGFDES